MEARRLQLQKNGCSLSFITSVMKIIERAVVSSKREGVITDNHVEEGAVAGATREALSQIMKIGVARYKDHFLE